MPRDGIRGLPDGCKGTSRPKGNFMWLSVSCATSCFSGTHVGKSLHVRYVFVGRLVREVFSCTNKPICILPKSWYKALVGFSERLVPIVQRTFFFPLLRR